MTDLGHFSLGIHPPALFQTHILTYICRLLALLETSQSPGLASPHNTTGLEVALVSPIDLWLPQSWDYADCFLTLLLSLIYNFTNVKSSPCKHEDFGLFPRHQIKLLDIVVCAPNPSNGETETGKSASLTYLVSSTLPKGGGWHSWG